MAHGILDLVQKSQYSAFLNEKPDITFFKVVYPRYTHYSKDFRTDPLSGSTEWGSELVSNISKVGDLLHHCYLVFELSISMEKALIKYLTPILWTTQVYSLLEQALPLAGSDLTNVQQLMISIAPRVNVMDITTTPCPESYTDAVAQFGATSLALAYLCIDYYQYINNGGMQMGNNNLIKFIRAAISLQGTPPLLAHFLIQRITIDIAGQNVCTYTGETMNALMQLRKETDNNWYTNNTIGFNFKNLDNVSSLSCTVYLPVLFWFTEQSTLSLPLVALRYANVSLIVQLAATALDSTLQIDSVSLCTENIYLTAQERYRFTSSSLEYLIEDIQEETQYCTFDQLDTTIELDFVRPIKYLLWWVSFPGHTDPNFLLPDGSSPIQSCSIMLNHSAVGAEIESEYYRIIQPEQYFERTPVNGIHAFSFALYPLSPQPSGTCNFSMITSKLLNVTWNPAVLSMGSAATVHIIAVGVNVMRISNGFCQLLE